MHRMSSSPTVHQPSPPKLSAADIAQKLKQIQLSSDEYNKDHHIFKYRISGNETTMLEVDLAPGQGVRTESGAMLYMNRGIQLDTSTGGGFSQAFNRMISGDTFFVTTYVNQADSTRTLALAPAYPCKLVPIMLQEHGSRLITQRGSFMAGSIDTTFEIYFTKSIGVGLFGGKGIVLSKIQGNGLVLLKAGGSLIMQELQAGETILVAPGSLIAFETSVDFGIELIPGWMNRLFGQGFFYATLTGPGKVWLQSLPFKKFVSAIAKNLPFRGMSSGTSSHTKSPQSGGSSESSKS